MIVAVGSVRVSPLVASVMPVEFTASRIATSIGKSNVTVVGRTTMRMPAKPTSVAVQRRQPTFSPSTGPAAMVVKITLPKKITVAVASGRFANT